MTKSPKTPEIETVEPAPIVKKMKIGSVVSEMLTSTDMAYDAIVEAIIKQFPQANTTARSIASVAARLRKTGVDVPTRRKAAKGDAA